MSKQITCPSVVCYGCMENITAVVNHGASLGLSWVWKFNETNKTLHTDQGILKNTKNFNFSKAGNTNISIHVSNAVSSSSTLCTVVSLYPINRSYILLSKQEVYSTQETAVFGINQTAEAKLPIGMLNARAFVENVVIPLPKMSDFNITHFKFEHNFSVQGDYNVTIELTSAMGSVNISTIGQIWDSLNQLKVTASKSSARVGEIINITMQDYPHSNFRYNLSFGDESHTTSNHTWNSFDESFDPPIHQISYNQSGLYTISLMAWNRKYNKSCIFNVWVQYPIRNISISPDTYSVPLPDGRVDFNITHEATELLPTNATCNISSNNTRCCERDIKSDVVPFYITFDKPGFHIVDVNCSNRVSSVDVSALINVTNITIHDIFLSYHKTSPMNTARGNESYPFEVHPEPSTVTFEVHLLNCSRLPYGVDENWNFGDQEKSQIYNNRTDLTRTHSFRNRGKFTLNVSFTLNNDSYRVVSDIVMGNMELIVNKTNIIFKRENFTIVVSEVGKIPIYRLEVKDNGCSDYTNQTNSVSLKYYCYGYHMPKIIGYWGTFVEEVYYHEPLVADYDLEHELELYTSAAAVPLPPGNISYSVILNSSSNDIFPFVTCSFFTGDQVNRVNPIVSNNISLNNPTIANHTYNDLGNQTIVVNCKNSVSNTTLTKNVEVINVCFGDEGIFDHTFSMPLETKMQVFDSSEVYIANRMNVLCTSDDIRFDWTNCQSLDWRKGVCLYNGTEMNEMNPVTLNVSIPHLNTHITEPIYIEVNEVSPLAYIIGGNKRYAHEGDIIRFEAKMSKNNKKAEYSWKINQNR